jgi:hypothetical protein
VYLRASKSRSFFGHFSEKLVWCFHAILKGKDDHESIFLVKDFGGSAPRKINKEEQVGGRDISESQNFCMQNNPKKTQNFSTCGRRRNFTPRNINYFFLLNISRRKILA